jgi:hypothetical protein
MLIKFYFIYLLYLGINLMTVYDDKNTNVFNKIKGKKLSEKFMKLDRIKRSGPPSITTISYTSPSSTSDYEFLFVRLLYVSFPNSSSAYISTTPKHQCNDTYNFCQHYCNFHYKTYFIYILVSHYSFVFC